PRCLGVFQRYSPVSLKSRQKVGRGMRLQRLRSVRRSAPSASEQAAAAVTSTAKFKHFNNASARLVDLLIPICIAAAARLRKARLLWRVPLQNSTFLLSSSI